MTFELCADSTPALWMAFQNLPWYRLARRGPIGFEKYARLLFIPDPKFSGQKTSDIEFDGDSPSELMQVATALNVLTGHTTTPDECYFAIWDGWDSITIGPPPNFKIHNRDYWLIRGTLADYEHWNSANPALWAYGDTPDPAFIFPADHAWCITNDVDPHFATIAATAEAIDEILGNDQIDTVLDDPDSEPDYWH
ncbi:MULTISPECIES: hypothetical protein [unclassified Rhodococcus (in: high G+C Gram-positive bacteria)]|uniref:hypothetical protein n=1 Tax=unclassified Rhodococcus (in: high G+C Gram-positive bacteria) TaxID=192944 RepID=UPI00339A9DB0